MVDLLEWAESRPLFNLNEAERALGLERDYLREKLSRKVKSGDLIRVERSKYTVHDDAFIYATYVDRPSYISFWSAMDFYGLTTQEPTKVQVVCSRNRDDLDDIKFFRSKNLFGFRKESYQGFEVTVAEEERLLVDILSRGVVPVSELEELVKRIDMDKTVKMVERYGRKSVSKRAGFLLERFRGREIEELKVDDRNYPVLDLSLPETGETDSKWGLRVNTDAV